MENRLRDPFPDPVYRAAVQQSPDWLWIFDETGTPVGVSPQLNAGTSLYRWVYESDLAVVRNACRVLLEQRVPFVHMFRAVQPSGTLLWLEARGYPLDGPGAEGKAAISARDITPYKQQEERLTRLAYCDALTGLPNRRLFQDRITQALHVAKRYHQKIALLYLDLDDFKQVNDTYGHSIGDELLVNAASRLSHSIREPDTVCRMGGDEFVVLLQQFEQREDIAKIAARIGEALRQPFELSGQSIRITCSIGASFYPEDGMNEEMLLQCADAAMYASKQQGKDDFHFYA